MSDALAQDIGHNVVRKSTACEESRCPLSAARVHFEMRILAQTIDVDQPALA
jgi:hypothetical protein